MFERQLRLFSGDVPGRKYTRPARRFHIEQLESRLVFSATSLIAATAADFAANADIAVAAGENTQQQDPFPTFESAEELRSWLIQLADEQYGHLFGTEYEQSWRNWYVYSDDVVVPRAANFDAVPISGAALNADYSSTNIQVAGVDEADLLETDGEFLYLISGSDLVIVKAGAGDELEDASRMKLGAAPTGMYLDGDRLVLVSSQAQYEPWSAMSFIAIDTMYPPTYGQYGSASITVLDIADRYAPTLVQRLEVDGHIQDSRVVGGQLRLVINSSFQLPALESVRIDAEGNAPTRYRYESREAYIERRLETFLPRLRQINAEGQVVRESPLVDAKTFYRPDSANHRTLTTIATLDMHSNVPGLSSTASLMHDTASTVHATKDSIYLFSQGWSHFTSNTKIQKFDIDAQTGDIQLVANGEVNGTLLNQFAADEYDGYLRVVTQMGSWHGEHELFVLEQVGHQLKVIGQIGGMAPGEELHSVRFAGEEAFVVTFRKVDPLFAIDLSDPANPVVEGELKVPGFSDYLHVIDENHLLGIGRGANENRGLFQEMQVSIFDVSDLSDPQLIHRTSIGGGRSTASVVNGDRWAEGDGDHHAVGYFPSEQILAIPIFNAGATGWDRSSTIDNTPIFEQGEGGLQVFHIDTATGFESLTIIEHATLISRSLVIGDQLIAISPGTISAHSLADPTVELDRLEILASDDTGYTDLVDYRPFGTVPSVLRAAGNPAAQTALVVERAVIDRAIDSLLSVVALGSAGHGQAGSLTGDAQSVELAESSNPRLNLDVADELALDWQAVHGAVAL